MGNVHWIRPKWSDIIIDTDKDMNGKSLTNLNEVDAQIFSPQNGFQITKSPERDSVRISTPFGYVDIGPMNKYNTHFYTDKPTFFFSKNVCVNGSIYPYRNNAYELGFATSRWSNVWIAGNLGLGVIQDIGTPLTVDVIYQEADTEVYNKPTQYNYFLTERDRIRLGRTDVLDTYTTNGISTRVTLTFEYSSEGAGGIIGTWEIFENSALVISDDLITTNNQFVTKTYTWYTINQSSQIEIYIDVTPRDSRYDFSIRNIRVMFARGYLGIKSP